MGKIEAAEVLWAKNLILAMPYEMTPEMVSNVAKMELDKGTVHKTIKAKATILNR